MRTFLRLSRAAWLLLSVTLADFVPNSHAQTNTALLPTNIIGVGVAPITDISLITNHFAWIALTNVSAGYSVTNGYYPAWCVEGDTPFSDTNWFSMLYDSLGTNLPVALLAEPWPDINYILNHKLGAALDIQFAIWYVQDGTPISRIDPGPTQDMVVAARQYGTNFFPSPGQLRAIVVDPTARVQRLVLEIVDPITPAAGSAQDRDTEHQQHLHPVVAVIGHRLRSAGNYRWGDGPQLEQCRRCAHRQRHQ